MSYLVRMKAYEALENKELIERMASYRNKVQRSDVQEKKKMNQLERRYLELMIQADLSMNQKEARKLINEATRLREMIVKAKAS